MNKQLSGFQCSVISPNSFNVIWPQVNRHKLFIHSYANQLTTTFQKKRIPDPFWRLRIHFWSLAHKNSSFSPNCIIMDIITKIFSVRFKTCCNTLLTWFTLSSCFYPILYITTDISKERFCDWGTKKRFVGWSKFLLGQCLNRRDSLKYPRYWNHIFTVLSKSRFRYTYI